MSWYERLTGSNHKELGFQTYEGPMNPYEAGLTMGELSATNAGNYSPREILKEVFDRLAQYEDIGSPEEFAEFVKIKEEGRLIVLPYKIGDNVYTIEGDNCP